MADQQHGLEGAAALRVGNGTVDLGKITGIDLPDEQEPAPAGHSGRGMFPGGYEKYGLERSRRAWVARSCKSADSPVSKAAGCHAAEPAWKPAAQQTWKSNATNFLHWHF